MGEPRALLPIDDAAQFCGIGRSKFYALVREGEIPVVKIGRRTLVSRQALDEFVGRVVASASAEEV